MSNNFNKNYNHLFKSFYFVACGMHKTVYAWKSLFLNAENIYQRCLYLYLFVFYI